MYKKFLNAILFGALILGSAGTITSCKDYDDEIDEINQRISNIGGLSDQLATLTSQLSTAASEASAAKSSATSALEAASKAVADAKLAGDAAAAAAADAAVAKATADAAAADAKAEAIAAAKAEVEALAKKIDATPKGLSDEDIKKLQDEVDKAAAKVIALLGHRLESLAVIPTTHINGIAAITLTSLQYTPQEYVALPKHTWGQDKHQTRPVLDHKNKTNAKTFYVSSKENYAYYHVSPNNGVRKQDVDTVYFNNIQSSNMTRADVNVQQNKLIEATKWEVNKNVMKVTFQKAPGMKNTPISTKGLAHTDAREDGVSGTNETFPMVSLRAEIAEDNLTEQEKANGGAYVNSEYVRVEELFKAPYIANKKVDWSKPIERNKFADEVQNGMFVHYHDSICAYDSKVNDYVDILAPYDKELNLLEWVTVCTTDIPEYLKNHENHENLENYADYGLGFRFYVAGTVKDKDGKVKVVAPYYTLGGQDNNSNKTDQQQFAEIKDAKKGIMTSKVYTITGDPNQTSVGREPLVRVELWDEENGNLIGIRYIKVKWVEKEIPMDPIKVGLNYTPSLYACGPLQGVIGTKSMNEDFYAQIGENGMDKKTFHQTWPDPAKDPTTGRLIFTEGTGDGVVELIKNDEDDVESYNILWTIDHNTIVKKYPDWYAWDNEKPMTFTKTITWRSINGAPLEITFTRKVYKEDLKLWGYDGRYWKNDNKWETFNVNPIVYDTKEANPAWLANETNNPTSNIYTDLLNGFLDDMGKKPTTGADGVIYFDYTLPKEGKVNARNDRVVFNADGSVKSIKSFTYVPGNKYYYAADYQNVSSGFRGVDRLKNDYMAFSKEGVRFIFDEEKLANNTDTFVDRFGVEHQKYVYDFYRDDTKTYEKVRAYLKNNDTELWIKTKDGKYDQKAATIVNFAPNFLNPSEMTYNIKLEEANPDHKPYSGDKPTEAAKAIVGMYVPLKLVANLCDDTDPAGTEKAHLYNVKAYDAFIIEPLRPNMIETDNFLDAKIGGSTISVSGANVYLSWNADTAGKDDYYKVKEAADHNAPKGLAEELGNFYEVVNAQWPTKEEMPKVIRTNLRLVDGNLIPVELKDWPANELVNGIPQGSLPSNTEVLYDAVKESLTYHNYSGTPVNWDYDIYVPVKYGYKWKTAVQWVKVHVSSNTGTDNENKK